MSVRGPVDVLSAHPPKGVVLFSARARSTSNVYSELIYLVRQSYGSVFCVAMVVYCLLPLLNGGFCLMRLLCRLNIVGRD